MYEMEGSLFMYRLYLVRHARTHIDPARHHSEWDLAPEGLPLLEEMAALPHWAGACRIVSSTEPKALRTAEVLARRHGLPPVEPLDALRELHKASFVPNHDEVMAAVFHHPERPAAEGWETAQAALARFAAAVGRLIAEAGEEDLIVVSHGTVLSLYVAHLRGLERVDPAEWRVIGMPDFCVVDTQEMRVIQPFGAWR